MASLMGWEHGENVLTSTKASCSPGDSTSVGSCLLSPALRPEGRKKWEGKIANRKEKSERRRGEVNQGNGWITVNEHYTSLHDLSCRDMI